MSSRYATDFKELIAGAGSPLGNDYYYQTPQPEPNLPPQPPQAPAPVQPTGPYTVYQQFTPPIVATPYPAAPAQIIPGAFAQTPGVVNPPAPHPVLPEPPAATSEPAGTSSDIQHLIESVNAELQELERRALVSQPAPMPQPAPDASAPVQVPVATSLPQPIVKPLHATAYHQEMPPPRPLTVMEQQLGMNPGDVPTLPEAPVAVQPKQPVGEPVQAEAKPVATSPPKVEQPSTPPAQPPEPASPPPQAAKTMIATHKTHRLAEPSPVAPTADEEATPLPASPPVKVEVKVEPTQSQSSQPPAPSVSQPAPPPKAPEPSPPPTPPALQSAPATPVPSATRSVIPTPPNPVEPSPPVVAPQPAPEPPKTAAAPSAEPKPSLQPGEVTIDAEGNVVQG